MKRTVLNERQQQIVTQMARNATDEQILAVASEAIETEILGHVDRETLRELVRRYKEINGAKSD